jgi:hypothetical protein
MSRQINFRAQTIEPVEVEHLRAFREKVSGVYKDTGDRIGAELVAEARKLASS